MSNLLRKCVIGDGGGLHRGKSAKGRVGRSFWSSRSWHVRDGTRSNILKDNGEEMSLTECVSWSYQSSCLDFDLVDPTS